MNTILDEKISEIIRLATESWSFPAIVLDITLCRHLITADFHRDGMEEPSSTFRNPGQAQQFREFRLRSCKDCREILRKLKQDCNRFVQDGLL